MASEHIKNKLMSLEVRGNFGYPDGCGEYRLGFNALGEESDYSGTYQRQYGRFGAFFKRKRYYPEYVNPTPGTLAGRANVIAGAAAWQALTEPQKAYWRNLQHPERMTGYNRFMKKYLKGAL